MKNHKDDHFDNDFEFGAYCIIFVTVTLLIWQVWEYFASVHPVRP